MLLSPGDVERSSPTTLAILELRTQQDLSILRHIVGGSKRLGDAELSIPMEYHREFDMTNDSKHFPPSPSGPTVGSIQRHLGTGRTQN